MTAGSSNGGNRVRPATAIYRTLMMAIEQRRVELGLSMERVNDLAGLQDGFFGKMIYPDSPSGRQSRWETIDLVMQALFGADYIFEIAAQNYKVPNAFGTRANPSANAVQIRHWRHTRHFSELGKKSAEARKQWSPDRLSAVQRKIAKNRWRRARAAERAG
jgi:hypothetical protein